MLRFPLVRRLLALGLLIGGVALIGHLAVSALLSFTEGQREIAARQAQLQGLRELAAARTAFDRLVPRKGGPAPILPADADAAAALTSAVTQAAEGQQVIVDGTEPLPAEPVTRVSAVHLRGTQAGLYGFLKAIEGRSPYLVVPRIEVTPSRSADPEHGKPFVVSADLRVAVLVAPAVARKAPPVPTEAALP
ncbi:type II secretion system protein GspM [Lichenihabitans sp. Uapishka_5]|uniref:type II secretion system protein GspM n=1 Tax=Lichenihabitans sp. Uapishka_5 TaxID=3037302 RepID=UPI0029E7D41C|nr:type II secretion system protein GspM [Lichenihabitans sp. Uapishka_5]MDX7951717.1 type II secretion system protein GspM [Lichenihabitans sp. Uapishka_5]